MVCKTDTQVIIIGAGPVGLTAGIALRHHGIECIILEKRESKREHSRANNVWSRTQELLDTIGLRKRLASHSYSIKRINFSMLSEKSSPIEINEVESPFPNVQYSGQDIIEATMLDYFKELGGELWRNQEVNSLSQDDDNVVVNFVDTVSEKKQTLNAQYVIAADGANGNIRSLIGLDIEPEPLPNYINRQCDAKLTWRRANTMDQLWFFYYENGFAGVMPVWGEYHRLFFLSEDDGIADRDPTLSELQEIAQSVTGDDTLTLSDPQWITHSRFRHGCAKHYAKGRIFLAGDAGHIALPIGGQGMNAGFHDAIGLAWRLAMSIQGRVTKIVLDSYSAERSKERSRLDKQQRKGFDYSVNRGAIKNVFLKSAFRYFPQIGKLLQGSNDLQQLDVSYRQSSLSEDKLVSFFSRHKAVAGDRAPDAEVKYGNNTINLFSLIYNCGADSTGWALFLFDAGNSIASLTYEPVIDIATRYRSIYPHFVLSGSLFNHPKIMTLSDLENKAHREFGIKSRPTLVLIRPDGHIAFRSYLSDLKSFSIYCKKIFIPT